METQELVADVERLLEDLETLADPVARQTATGVVQALLELYGAGLERMVDEIAPRDVDGEIARAFADDELISHLLSLHGLHPVPLEQRVRDALTGVRPYLESHGGNVELLEVDGSTVRLRMEGSCSGCPSSAMTLKLAIENAIQKAAPEIAEVVAQEQEPAAAPSLLQIEIAPAPAAAPAAAPAPVPTGAWTTIGALREVEERRVTVKQVEGAELALLRLTSHLYAYRAHCPACEHPLDGAAIEGSELTCPGCGDRYDALRAGRGLDRPELHLEPVPLLEGDDGLVRIALPALA
jgi:Fe-S cluster biogenesis protein NfuA/nitrite reductase/ring-hydroxylating ferredoxin subunit